MGFVDIGDLRVETVERGQGDAVVLVHGSASDRRTWQSPMNALGESYRVVAYSRRYHWPNPPIPGGADYSMAEHVDDLEKILDALDVAPAHLVGHSYGAFVCVLLAIRRPELVRSLVLAEPPVLPLFASNPPKPLEILALLLTRPRTAIAILNFGIRGLGPATAAARRGHLDESMNIFGTAVLGRDSFRRLSPARLEQLRANFFKEELLGSGFAPLDDRQVRAVRIRTLLVTGQRSPRLFHRFADRLQELLPNAGRVEIPKASHLLHEDNASAYGSALLGFLESVGPPERE